MKLEGITLEKWLDNSNASYDLRGRTIKFYSLYEGLKSYLLPKHEETTKGAIIESIKDQIKELEEEGGEKENKAFELQKVVWLNDHGLNHIDTVVKRASQMLDSSDLVLTPREVYCLLSAIQIHDLGNFYGRTGHEKKIMDIVNEGRNHIGSDQIERKHILQIAEVHGGKVPKTGSKDTISQLKRESPVLDDIIRIRLVASILRFADELADDRQRADIELLNEGRIPNSSEVFHAYSACLNSVLINHDSETIELHFDINKKYLEKKFGKNNEKVFLIEEIYERVLKMHQERVYCSRYWKSHLFLENILVIINFYSDDIHEEVHSEITFTLSEKGYPNTHHSIYEMCPELVKGGNELNGEYFKKHLTE